MKTPAYRARTRRKASVLLASIIAIFLATALIAIMVVNAGQTKSHNISARQYSETVRCVSNLIEFGGITIKNRLNRPTAKYPEVELASGFTATQLTTANDYAKILGINTSRYTVINAQWNLADPAKPVITNWDIESSDFTGVAFKGVLDPNHPANLTSPSANNFISKIWTIPITATLTLADKGSGKVTTATATCNVQLNYTPFLQYSYYFNGINTILTQGIQTKHKGGIFTNGRIDLWTNDFSNGYKVNRATIQIDHIAAKYASFNNLNQGPRGTTNNYNGVYISAGDLNQNGKLDYFASKDTPNSNPFNPYDVDKTKVKSDFLPAYLTAADVGASRTSNYANNFNNVDGSSLPGYKTNNTDTTLWTDYYKIDSNNPNIATLAQRFNGNFVDAQTGFKEQYPSSFSKAMIDGTTDAHAMIDPPNLQWAEAAQDTNEKDAENSKFSNKSKFYVLVENPSSTTTAGISPVVFNDPKVAATYKVESATLTTAAITAELATNSALKAEFDQAKVPALEFARLQLRKKYAANIIRIPANVVEVKRSFYDMSQRRYDSSDPVKSIRVSAVDLNLGALRDAIGSAEATLPMADGTTWKANENWNGVVYVDVVNPKGAGWVSHDQSGNPLTYQEGVLAAAAEPTTAVSDPINSASEEGLVAVRVYNAGEVPNRNGTPGLTLATNTSVYTVGNINADGLSTTDKNAGTGFADSSVTPEPKAAPFCIACDSLTAFSGAFYQGDSTYTNLDRSDKMLANITGRVTQPTGFNKFHEMNFALISGGSDATEKKGTSCVPAFVVNIPNGEDRGGLNVRYRGARNVLFKSKYNKKLYNNEWKSYENSNDEAFDLTLRGLNSAPPAMPTMNHFSLVNFRLQ